METTIAQIYHKSEEEEKKLILREYRALLRSLKERLKKGDRPRIRRAFEIAAESHKDMRRKSGEPYILHPIAVARIAVEEIGLGVTSAICALLHDVVEDTEVTLEDIESEFGANYSKIIDGLTKISNVVDLKSTTTEQAENFRKILLTLAHDPRVILIKLADRLHNMRTLDSMKREKQLKIASETTYIYAPLAHRLGLYEIKSELEDLSLKYTQPDVYEEISQGLKETKRERTRYINEFSKPIKEALKTESFKFEIYGRPKSIHSIWNKIKTKHVSFEEVYDIFAIRIILDTPQEKEKEDCWRVYSIVTNFYRPSPDRLRDWISVPKGNGYEALHTTVMGPSGRWVEVQIRSKRMNEIAEKGVAAHWKYKEGREKNAAESKLDSWLQHLRDMLNNPDTDTIDFLQDIKLDLFTEEIYIYTPKGDMRVLPQGATALDFAFDIHSELGAKCIGAKVNYRLVPISHELKTGDQVEIITSSKQKPSEDWLNFVITGKAKSRIKYYLKEEKRIVAQDGKEILHRKLNNMHVPASQHNLNEIVAYFKKQSPLDVYYGIAVGSLDIKELRAFTVHGDKLQQPVKEVALETKLLISEKEEQKNIPSKDTELIIFGESSDKILYKLAQCCQPIPGDDVFGFITSGEGLKIHRTDCPNAAQLLANYGHRVVKTKWAKNKEISFLTGVRIIGLDDVGVIQKITNVISADLKVNMRSISIDSHDGVFDGTIMVYVRDKAELDKLCAKLEALDGINKVIRLQVSDK
ncbi:MAG: bifunctional (p)ppGpp synthetase/guanosine-3',5'-bis(diphosphate) 3'-pyrophosphohydrolase [Chitinophagales bacterium]|nr:bifunctional (p)ppGpp synthetase/guanosine-3',5'-bis(diphosphate) 3'-pyrophosphohydrolase [Chitinophagaceae bacterium]MCB9064769.1 bifunctional (p)ppGpp synthetase/guanosine-3',5'-bis(diphosphate) 3'-pyrophosphohydrolase [Chitinophagales bacterium]